MVAVCMPQQKILEDEFPLAGPQRTAASTARYLTTIGFWTSLNLDDVVERAAMGTFKKRPARGRNVRRFAPSRHGTPPRCCNEQRRYVFGGPRAIRYDGRYCQALGVFTYCAKPRAEMNAKNPEKKRCCSIASATGCQGRRTKQLVEKNWS
jgi:hypothetical protein